MKITVDLIMSTNPCHDWPRARVERLLASPTVDASSWVAFAESCRRRMWRSPSLDDLRLTACRYAAEHHQGDVLIPWVQEVTRLRVTAQRNLHGAAATPETLAIWAALESWDGTSAQADALRDRAHAAWRQAADADAYAAADAADDATDAAAVVHDAAYFTFAAAYDAAAAAAAAAAYDYVAVAADAADTYDSAWPLLLSLCQHLDSTVIP